MMTTNPEAAALGVLADRCEDATAPPPATP